MGAAAGPGRPNPKEQETTNREAANEGGVRFRLPATSANLGPGFDTLALALDLALTVHAEAAGQYSIAASGRNREICSSLKGNLLLHTYETLWRRHRADPPSALALTVDNGIPLGMGCGSSAASRFAGAGLANHFGRLGWDRRRLLDEVTALEHHPDNAAACCLGGFTVSSYAPETEAVVDRKSARRVLAASFPPPASWRALLVLGEKPLATTASRAVLPRHYPVADVVRNLQNTALLTAAFARGDGALLKAATVDRLHQPYRGEVCPLLPRLLPLAGSDGILSVTLSGAGSGVLLLLEHGDSEGLVRERIRSVAGELPIAEMLLCGLGTSPAVLGEIP
jgi:homoserine kinase